MIQRIILVRKKHGLSQEQFAEKLGLSRNFINQVETGKRNFSTRTINDICRRFHVKEEWLRTGNGPMDDDLSTAQTPMQDIFDRFNCSESERKFLSAFFGLQESERQAFCDLLVKMFPEAIQQIVGDNPLSSPYDLDFEEAPPLEPVTDSQVLSEAQATSDDVETLAQMTAEITREQAVVEKKDRMRQSRL